MAEQTRYGSSRKAFVVALGLMVIAAGGLQAAILAMDVVLHKKKIEADRKLLSLPTETRSWVRLGEDTIEGKEMVEELGTQNYLTRRYIQKDTPEGEEPVLLQLHAAYYTGMVDTVPHVPDRCLVGAGWTLRENPRNYPMELDRDLMAWVEDSAASDLVGQGGPIYTALIDPEYATERGLRRVRLPREIEDLELRVSSFSLPDSDRRLYAGYFFIANGGVASTAERVRELAFDLKSEYAYYLKVQVSSASVGSSEELAEVAGGFFEELLPEIMRCVPDWAELEAGRYASGEKPPSKS